MDDFDIESQTRVTDPLKDPGTGANIYNWGPQYISNQINDINSKGRILPKMSRIEIDTVVKRSYERPLFLYYLTFKPFNKDYTFEYDGMNDVKKRMQKELYETIIITTEINATKKHYNVLAWSDVDLVQRMHERYIKKYKIFATKVGLVSLHRNDLSGYKNECMKVINYVLKEMSVRSFVKNVDYYVHDRYLTNRHLKK